MIKRINAAGLTLDYSGSQVPTDRLAHTTMHLQRRLKELAAVVKRKDYSSDAASLLLPSEKKFVKESAALASKLSDATALVLFGMGGPGLGPASIFQAVCGSNYNAMHPQKQVFFFSTIDPALFAPILKGLKDRIARGEKIVICASSQSGTTPETNVNFRFILSQLGDYPSKNRKYVVVISNEGSKFASVCRRKGFSVLLVPKAIGGRYSVFTDLGLFPLGWAGVDTAKLLEGAKRMRDACLSPRPQESPAAILASIAYRQFRKGKNIHDNFIFATDFEGLGKWYRQLSAESLGKEFNAAGTLRLRAGFTPTVSIGTTDLHSTWQLYLGGPQDKFFRLVTTAPARSTGAVIPKSAEFDSVVPNLGGKTPAQVLQATIGGVKANLESKRIPFVQIVLADTKEATIGALMQLEMIEVMLLGHLMGVNPFDQPAVETYKEETRRILAGKSKG